MLSLPSRIEAILFVAAEPATEGDLCEATGAKPEEIRRALWEISAASKDRGFVLREVGGGWRLASNPEYRADVERYLLPPKTHMSPASLDTLAIVAYLQPVTKPEIESLRGVNVDGVMATLEERRLVREVGRKDVVGRPILYGTTELFLETFGLKSIDELTPLPDGAPARRDGTIVHFPMPHERAAALEQIHESIEGHEDEVPARADAKLTANIAVELAKALDEEPGG